MLLKLKDRKESTSSLCKLQTRRWMKTWAKRLQLVLNDPDNSKELDKLTKMLGKILSNSSKIISKNKKSYKATKRRKEKKVDPKIELEIEFENNLLFRRTKTIKNFWKKSCVPKHQLQTCSKENLGQIFSMRKRLRNSKLAE